MEDVKQRLEPTRRDFLGTIAAGGLTALAGCNTGDNDPDSNPTTQVPTPTETATNTPTTTPTDTPTEQETPTATEEKTPTEEPNHDTTLKEDLEIRNAGLIPEVTDGNRDVETRIGGRFYDEEGIAKFALYVTPEDEDPWRIRTKEHGPKTAEVNEPFKKKLLGPGKNTIGLEFWDKEGDKQSFTHTITPPEIQENPGYRIDLKDKHDTITDAASNYSTERRWDDVEATRTEKEWWNMYWNDWNRASNYNEQYNFGDLDHLKTHINEDVEDPEAMLNSMVAGIHHHIENHTRMDSSGATSSIFYAAERKLAKDIWNLDQDQFFSTWITGNAGNHEVNFVAYDNNALDPTTDEEDWQLKFHNTYASVLTDHAFNHPEQTEYRNPNQGTQLDGFNYSKLLKYANPDEPEEIHVQPAMSLMHFAETSGNDFTDEFDLCADNFVFEKSYLESLEENTYNKNFDKDVLDNLIKAGRTLYEATEDPETNLEGENATDFIGIGGELGNEKTYRLNKEQYEKAVDSFKYDIWEKAGPENPMNDLSQLITSAS